MPDDRARPLREDQRRRRRLDAFLLGVVAVVPARWRRSCPGAAPEPEAGSGRAVVRHLRCERRHRRRAGRQARPIPRPAGRPSWRDPRAGRSMPGASGHPRRSRASRRPRTSRRSVARSLQDLFSILSGGPRTGRYATLRIGVNLSAARGSRVRHGVDPMERIALGRTGLRVTRLAFGGASIGGLFSEIDDDAAIATVRHAWDIGIRAFDTAPLYGYGASERRTGAGLQGRPRDEFVLSTKVGRLVRAESDIAPDTDIDRQRLGDREDAFYIRHERCEWSSTTAPTAFAARSRRASNASAWIGSTSSSSMTRTTIGRPRSTAPGRPSRGFGRRAWSVPSAPA